MKKRYLGKLAISEIAYGTWRVTQSDLSPTKLEKNLQMMSELGINCLDSVQIYGLDYHQAEKHLGTIFQSNPQLRKKFIIVTKAGVIKKQLTDVKHYKSNKSYLLKSVNASIKAMNCEYIDLFLLHRPDIFANYQEIYCAFEELKTQKLVTEFGVCNYTPQQFESLQMYLSKRGINLVTNQIEINNFTLEHYYNGNVDYLKGNEISPMIWSPLAGGKIFENNDIAKAIEKLAVKYDVDLEAIVISYLHNQGLNPITILGTNKIARIKSAMKGLNIKLTTAEKFYLLENLTKEAVK